jgi:hypothetical protein
MSDVGEYLVTVVVSDTLSSVSSSFKVQVVNTAPYFVKEVPKDFTMKFNTTYTLYVPKFTDNEGHAVSVLLDSVPTGKLDFA